MFWFGWRSLIVLVSLLFRRFLTAQLCEKRLEVYDRCQVVKSTTVRSSQLDSEPHAIEVARVVGEYPMVRQPVYELRERYLKTTMTSPASLGEWKIVSTF